ncbi:MAG: hypothetical protein ACPG8F_06895 [Flavobacteriaceae bacterium]
MKKAVLGFLLACSFSCSPSKVPFERPVDTTSRPINRQIKQRFSFDKAGVSFSNQFDAARLNGVRQKNDSTYRLWITPENSPINNSAYYAFEILDDSV